MQAEEFQDGINEDLRMEELKLVPPNGEVFVAYTWEWVAAEDSETIEENNNTVGLPSESESESDQEECADERDKFESSFVTHTVSFKCIGANRDEGHQSSLRAAAKAIQEGRNVPVRLQREPENPKDSNAIAFQCHIGDVWRRVGYVVKEALPDVHDALNAGAILSVKFAWVKFLLCWSRSGPGFYAGINVSKQGDWSTNVMHCASTK